MVNRKKRLRKAEDEDNIELADYYRKEIDAKKRDKEEKQRILDKGG